MDICLSGGAIGSDTLWGEVALSLSHELIHFSFKSHNLNFKKFPEQKDKIYVLDYEDLLIADEYLKTANKTLNRKFPTRSNFNNNLLRRNYYQIKESERVYAIADIKYDVVQGGTGWAVQMFIDRKLKEAPDSVIECYVLDKITNMWFQYNKFNGYEIIEEVPTPHGIWTGIGSRQLNEQHIESVIKIIG